MHILMFFLTTNCNWFLNFMGFNHVVEILQSYVLFYLILTASFLFLLGWTHDLKRFFFFSELTWLCVFALLLSVSLKTNTNVIYSHAFFILVFTASEAVILACLLLITFETRKKRTRI